jgi:hypothetical protein
VNDLCSRFDRGEIDGGDRRRCHSPTVAARV